MLHALRHWLFPPREDEREWEPDAGGLAQVRALQLTTRRAVSNALAGAYKSRFRGSGLEFEEVREYQPGDDVRTIDWKVTARHGRPYVKTFVEERQLALLLLVDASASMAHGGGEHSKREKAAELCALLGQVAILEQDQVGLALCGARESVYLPARRSPGHVQRIVREVLASEPAEQLAPSAALAASLGDLALQLRRRSLVFIVSDFLLPLDAAQREEWLAPLRRLARKHDVIAVRLFDPLEESLPAAGLLRLQDPESGRWVELDAASRRVRSAWEAAAAERNARLLADLSRAGVERLELSTEADSGDALMAHFRARRSGRSRA